MHMLAANNSIDKTVRIFPGTMRGVAILVEDRVPYQRLLVGKRIAQ
jgi:hypothetical protein